MAMRQRGIADTPEFKIAKKKSLRVTTETQERVAYGTVSRRLSPFRKAKTAKESHAKPVTASGLDRVGMGSRASHVGEVAPHFGGKRLTTIRHVFPPFQLRGNRFDTGSEGGVGCRFSASITRRETSQKLGDGKEVFIDGRGLDTAALDSGASGEMHGIESELEIAAFNGGMFEEKIIGELHGHNK
jgi:hypothetical protein